MNKPTSLRDANTLKDGYEVYTKTFGMMGLIPEGKEELFKSAFYAGAGAYDTIMFKQITAANNPTLDGVVQVNITDKVMALHQEVRDFADMYVKRAKEILSRVNNDGDNTRN